VVPLAPVDQVIVPEQLFAVKFTLSPAHIVAAPAVTKGAAGKAFTVIEAVAKPEQFEPEVQVAV
jgi:hypothetical protein